MGRSTYPRRLPAAALMVMILTGPFAPAARPQDQSPAGCALCEDQHEIACPQCDGKGRRVIGCFGCAGSGEIACPICKSIEGEEIPKLGGRKLPRGSIPCINRYCKGGTVEWTGGGSNPCRVCGAKGIQRCPLCRTGRIKCWICSGKKQFSGVCSFCAGTKKTPCPGCRIDPGGKACLVCEGKALRPCQLCRARPAPRAACLACWGAGSEPCKECWGSGKVPCLTCGGAGQVRYVDQNGSSSGLRTCEECRKRGVLECEWCQKGRLECPKCERGKVTGWCGTCNAEGHVLCSGCFVGTYRGRRIFARLLRDHKEYARAVTFMEAALERARREIGSSAGVVILSGDRTDSSAEGRKQILDSIQRELDDLRALVSVEKDEG